MNILTSILNKFFAAADDLIEGMPITTKKMVQQIFFMFMFIAAVTAAVIGVSMGRKSADKGGVQLIKSTDDTFEIQVSRERESIGFSEMVGEQNLLERDLTQPEKNLYESGTSHEMQKEFPVIESEGPEKNTVSAPEALISDKPIDDNSSRIIDNDFSSSVIESPAPVQTQRETPPLESAPLPADEQPASPPQSADPNRDVRAPAQRETAPGSSGTDIREPSPILQGGDILE